uniref:Uncharacterized protein n=1 Tax=Avena sativa TaxID=4498 RepID=A0ACD5XDN9_AVESA
MHRSRHAWTRTAAIYTLPHPHPFPHPSRLNNLQSKVHKPIIIRYTHRSNQPKSSKLPEGTMSGVWVFRNGVVKLVENHPASAATAAGGGAFRRKALLHTPTGEVVASYVSLERKLLALGWERYYAGGGGAAGDGMLRFHKRSSVDLISLPKDFAHFGSVHMYDVVIKNRDAFRVIDV